jgi:hypothetical protein
MIGVSCPHHPESHRLSILAWQLTFVLSQLRHTLALPLPADATAYQRSARRQLLRASATPHIIEITVVQ